MKKIIIALALLSAPVSVLAFSADAPFTVGTSTSTYFSVNTNAKVGIGTPSPATNLEVVSPTSAPLEADNLWNTTGPAFSITSDSVHLGDGGTALSFKGKLLNGASGAFAAIKGGITTAWADDGYLGFFTRDGDTGSLFERMVLTSTGKIGIGTLNPDALLHVAGTGFLSGITVSSGANVTNGGVGSIQILPASSESGVSGRILFGTDGLGRALRIAKNTAGSVTDVVSITDAGSVGIGTTHPLKVVHINGADQNELMVSNAATPSGASGGGIFSMVTSDPSAADQRLGFLIFGKSDGRNAAAVSAFSSQAWQSGSAQGSYLTFATTPNNSTARVEVMRIDQAGNVGIGTATPSAKLDVAGSIKVGSAAAPKGITLYDTVSGSPYCLKITSGSINASAGACAN